MQPAFELAFDENLFNRLVAPKGESSELQFRPLQNRLFDSAEKIPATCTLSVPQHPPKTFMCG